MANNENTVQIQVEVLRAQLDKLIADINSLKNQKISVKVDTAGAAARWTGLTQLVSCWS